MRFIILFFVFMSLVYSQDLYRMDNIVDNLNIYKRNINTSLFNSTIKSIDAILYEYGAKRALSNAPELFEKTVNSVVYIATQKGSGAGSIIDREGHIITNYHVVENAKDSDIACVLYSDLYGDVRSIPYKNYLDVEIIGTDKSKDLALLKLKTPPSSLKPIEMGKFYNVKVAQDVFAIGHPHSYLWYYTSGTVNKIIKHSWHYREDFTVSANTIFTQTPINSGNSGGPLLDNKGRMVGVNSASNLQMQNVNYAIRIDDVERFVNNAKKGLTSKSTGYVSKSNKKSNDQEWTPIDENNNGVTDGYISEVTMDDGTLLRLVKLDENEDGIIELVVADSNLDGKIDIIMEDRRKDGSFSYWSTDNDYDGKIDWEGYIDT